MLRFRPAFCFTLRPGLAVVPLADLVMRFTRRSSMATQPWLLVRSVVSLWVKSCRRRACRARSLAAHLAVAPLGQARSLLGGRIGTVAATSVGDHAGMLLGRWDTIRTFVPDFLRAYIDRQNRPT